MLRVEFIPLEAEIVTDLRIDLSCQPSAECADRSVSAFSSEKKLSGCKFFAESNTYSYANVSNVR